MACQHRDTRADFFLCDPIMITNIYTQLQQRTSKVAPKVDSLASIEETLHQQLHLIRMRTAE